MSDSENGRKNEQRENLLRLTRMANVQRDVPLHSNICQIIGAQGDRVDCYRQYLHSLDQLSSGRSRRRVSLRSTGDETRATCDHPRPLVSYRNNYVTHGRRLPKNDVEFDVGDSSDIGGETMVRTYGTCNGINERLRRTSTSDMHPNNIRRWPNNILPLSRLLFLHLVVFQLFISAIRAPDNASLTSDCDTFII